MAQLFDIKKVTVGPRALTAEVEVAPNAPLLTSDDPKGTRLMVELMPQIADTSAWVTPAPTLARSSSRPSSPTCSST